MKHLIASIRREIRDDAIFYSLIAFVAIAGTVALTFIWWAFA